VSFQNNLLLFGKTMTELRCIRVSVYADALTRGKSYLEIARDESKQQVRIKDDRGKVRWYPLHCFDRGIEPLPTLIDYRINGPIEASENRPIEVTLSLSNGERRWCVVATPSALSACGDWIPGTEVRFHYGNRHVLIAEKLTEDLIGRMLRYIDSQGDLEECSLPLPIVDDEP
jgi:hypothetical protein